MASPNEHDRLLEQLYKQYGAGGGHVARTRLKFRYMRKRLMWRAVIGTSLALKRLLDITGAACGLLALSPVMIGTALAIRLEDKGPIFFKQERVGKWGKPFFMYKFRSMYVDAEARKQELMDKNETGGVTFKMKDDPRVTRTGRIIRKYSIDELPQFWNVLLGDMSLVGPRPAVPGEVAEYGVSDRRRLGAKPGITCFWQVGGRSEISFEQQVDLDVEYIQSQSVRLDIILLLKTVPAVLLGKGAY